MNVKIADVAKLANVGAGTVSRVLNGSSNVSPETRKRVLACIKELGYMPNLVARGLAANRTGMIGAVIPAAGYTLHAEVVQGLSDILHENGIRLMIGHCGYSMEREEQIVQAFLARRPDAFYVTGTWHSPETRRLLARSGIPVVEGANLTDDPIDYTVGYDNFEAARQLTHLLHARGHRHVVVVTSAGEPNDRMEGRLQGYLAGCAELGLDTQDAVLHCQNSFMGGADAITRMLQIGRPIDLVLASTDVMAVGAILECQRRNIIIPQQLGIAGFDDLPIASAVNPPLTTVRVDRAGMGRKAGEVLLRLLNQEILPTKHIDLGFEIMERGSTRRKAGD